MKKYDVIYSDPPWKYGSKGARSGKFGELDYSQMTIAQMCAMDVKSLAADNCALHMWVTASFAEDCHKVAKAWGFNKFIRIDRVWNKKYESGSPHGVCGPHGMSDCEFIFLYSRGRICPMYEGKRNQYTSVDELYTGKHSEKPVSFRNQIDKRYKSGLNKLEMFARYAAPGWDVFGNEAPNSININMIDKTIG